MKIDRDTFEFQMRLIRAETKAEALEEENFGLKQNNDIMKSQVDGLHQELKATYAEIHSLNAYIERHIKPSRTA